MAESESFRDKYCTRRNCFIVGLLVLAIVLVICICTEKFQPFTWDSPDYKLRNSHHVDKSRRSDSQSDRWNKKDFIASVEKFNKLAASK